MTDDAVDDLPTTAFAVLGLLGVSSFTGYQLTQQAARSMHFVWPKAESMLYAQPPRLVAAGLATVSDEPAGRRVRKRYAITSRGRRSLRRWLATEPSLPRIEVEHLLRVTFADGGSIDDALAAVRSLRTWVLGQAAQGSAVLDEYAASGGPFPERLHLQVLVARFYGELFEAISRWCDEAEAEVRRWASPTDPGPRARTRELLGEERERARRLLGEAVEADPPAEET